MRMWRQTSRKARFSLPPYPNENAEVALNSPISAWPFGFTSLFVPRICLSKPKILSFELSNFHSFNCQVLLTSYSFVSPLQKGLFSFWKRLIRTQCILHHWKTYEDQLHWKLIVKDIYIFFPQGKPQSVSENAISPPCTVHHFYCLLLLFFRSTQRENF